jgi:hypothetical protein
LFIFKASSSRLISVIASSVSPRLLILVFAAILKLPTSDVDRGIPSFNVWRQLEQAPTFLSVKARDFAIVQVIEQVV